MEAILQKDSPLASEYEKKEYPRPNYTDEEEVYFKNVVTRIKNAKDERDQPHDEFDGMTYLEQCEANRKGANTYVQPKKTKSDTNFASGTIRSKIYTYLSAVNNLDLGVDVQAFNVNNKEEKAVGEALEDIIFEVGKRDGEGGDEEKKLSRQYTLFEQGTAFVREKYAKRYKIKKKIQGKFNGEINTTKWTKALKMVYQGCTRQIILNENFIPGNIREFEMGKQPFIVDIDVMPYEEAKAIYGKWERWEYVPDDLRDEFQLDREAARFYNPFKLYKTKENNRDVEILKYQDKTANEQMIFINGVMMMPVGMPMTDDDYDIVKQVNELISPFFFFGKSMVFRLRNNAILLDEMLRLAVKKTQKSFAPPLINQSGRVLSQKVFAPGTITSGIKEGSVALLDPNSRGLESGEINMIGMLENKIDEKTVNPVFGGQQPSGTPTATQIMEVQKQAKMMMGLTVMACSLLEYKLGWLRLNSLLKHWFKPKKTSVSEEYEDGFLNDYRSVTREKMIEGYGVGLSVVRVADKKNIPSDADLLIEEENLSTKDRPVRIMYLDPKIVTSPKMTWFIEVTPKEKKSDALSKVLFNEMMQQLMQFPNANMAYAGERFAEVWEENPAKLFATPQEAPVPVEGEDKGPAAGVPNAPVPGKNDRSALLNMAAGQ